MHLGHVAKDGLEVGLPQVAFRLPEDAEHLVLVALVRVLVLLGEDGHVILAKTCTKCVMTYRHGPFVQRLDERVLERVTSDDGRQLILRRPEPDLLSLLLGEDLPSVETPLELVLPVDDDLLSHDLAVLDQDEILQLLSIIIEPDLVTGLPRPKPRLGDEEPGE